MLTHIRKLDDCFGQFLVRVSCGCGASRHIEPAFLVRLVGPSATLRSLWVPGCAARSVGERRWRLWP